MFFFQLSNKMIILVYALRISRYRTAIDDELLISSLLPVCKLRTWYIKAFSICMELSKIWTIKIVAASTWGASHDSICGELNIRMWWKLWKPKKKKNIKRGICHLISSEQTRSPLCESYIFSSSCISSIELNHFNYWERILDMSIFCSFFLLS